MLLSTQIVSGGGKEAMRCLLISFKDALTNDHISFCILLLTVFNAWIKTMQSMIHSGLFLVITLAINGVNKYFDISRELHRELHDENKILVMSISRPKNLSISPPVIFINYFALSFSEVLTSILWKYLRGNNYMKLSWAFILLLEFIAMRVSPSGTIVFYIQFDASLISFK